MGTIGDGGYHFHGLGSTPEHREVSNEELKKEIQSTHRGGRMNFKITVGGKTSKVGVSRIRRFAGKVDSFRSADTITRRVKAKATSSGLKYLPGSKKLAVMVKTSWSWLKGKLNKKPLQDKAQARLQKLDYVNSDVEKAAKMARILSTCMGTDAGHLDLDAEGDHQIQVLSKLYDNSIGAEGGSGHETTSLSDDRLSHAAEQIKGFASQMIECQQLFTKIETASLGLDKNPTGNAGEHLQLIEEASTALAKVEETFGKGSSQYNAFLGKLKELENRVAEGLTNGTLQMGSSLEEASTHLETIDNIYPKGIQENGKLRESVETQLLALAEKVEANELTPDTLATMCQALDKTSFRAVNDVLANKMGDFVEALSTDESLSVLKPFIEAIDSKIKNPRTKNALFRVIAAPLNNILKESPTKANIDALKSLTRLYPALEPMIEIASFELAEHLKKSASPKLLNALLYSVQHTIGEDRNNAQLKAILEKAGVDTSAPANPVSPHDLADAYSSISDLFTQYSRASNHSVRDILSNINTLVKTAMSSHPEYTEEVARRREILSITDCSKHFNGLVKAEDRMESLEELSERSQEEALSRTVEALNLDRFNARSIRPPFNIHYEKLQASLSTKLEILQTELASVDAYTSQKEMIRELGELKRHMQQNRQTVDQLLSKKSTEGLSRAEQRTLDQALLIGSKLAVRAESAVFHEESPPYDLRRIDEKIEELKATPTALRELSSHDIKHYRQELRSKIHLLQNTRHLLASRKADLDGTPAPEAPQQVPREATVKSITNVSPERAILPKVQKQLAEHLAANLHMNLDQLLSENQGSFSQVIEQMILSKPSDASYYIRNFRFDSDNPSEKRAANGALSLKGSLAELNDRLRDISPSFTSALRETRERVAREMKRPFDESVLDELIALALGKYEHTAESKIKILQENIEHLLNIREQLTSDPYTGEKAVFVEKELSFIDGELKKFTDRLVEGDHPFETKLTMLSSAITALEAKGKIKRKVDEALESIKGLISVSINWAASYARVDKTAHAGDRNDYETVHKAFLDKVVVGFRLGKFGDKNAPFHIRQYGYFLLKAESELQSKLASPSDFFPEGSKQRAALSSKLSMIQRRMQEFSNTVLGSGASRADLQELVDTLTAEATRDKHLKLLRPQEKTHLKLATVLRSATKYLSSKGIDTKGQSNEKVISMYASLARTDALSGDTAARDSLLSYRSEARGIREQQAQKLQQARESGADRMSIRILEEQLDHTDQVLSFISVDCALMEMFPKVENPSDKNEQTIASEYAARILTDARATGVDGYTELRNMKIGLQRLQEQLTARLTKARGTSAEGPTEMLLSRVSSLITAMNTAIEAETGKFTAVAKQHERLQENQNKIDALLRGEGYFLTKGLRQSAIEKLKEGGVSIYQDLFSTAASNIPGISSSEKETIDAHLAALRSL